MIKITMQEGMLKNDFEITKNNIQACLRYTACSVPGHCNTANTTIK